jgi:Methyltransferase domain
VSFSALFSPKRRQPDADAAPPAATHPTKALARFLSTVQASPQPVVVDLGPVVGSNVSFLGEQLGCKVFVEDVFRDLDRLAVAGNAPALASYFEQRLPQREGSVDGILCWDLFDYLDRASAHALVRALVRILRPDGIVMAMFGSQAPDQVSGDVFTRFVVVDATTLQYRPHACRVSRGRPLLNRDIQRTFEPLRITEQFLLKNHMREVVFRKAAEPCVNAASA